MVGDAERTDPRHHAAYQRGYQVPAAEVSTAAQERYARPGRTASAAAPLGRRDDDPARSASASAPETVDGDRHRLERTSGLGAPEDEASRAAVTDGHAGAASETDEQPRRIPVDRASLALAIMGVLFIAIGMMLLWAGVSDMYVNNGSQADEFGRSVMNFLPGPAIVTGLLALGAAIALKAVRA